MKCFLDMDGVLVNWHKGALKAHGKENLIRDWPLGEYAIEKVLGISADEFWKIDGHDFWSNLEIYDTAHEVIELCEDYFGRDNICLLSSPSYHPGCLSGKAHWIQNHIPNYSRRFIFTPQKRFFAQHNALLIDDHNKNVDDFEKFGGQIFLYPRPWNRNFGEHESITLNSLESRIIEFRKEFE